MKLTKLKALWLCHEMWSWLSKNPDENKEDWPEWKFNKGIYKAMHCCFACEYRYTQVDRHCNETCIVPAFRYEEDGCEHVDSPYDKWEYEGDRAKNARKISNSAYREYKRVGGKRNKIKV